MIVQANDLSMASVVPDRRKLKQKRRSRAEGKIKGRGTGPRRKAVCTWGARGTRERRRCAVRGVKAVGVVTLRYAVSADVGRTVWEVKR